MDKHEVTIEFVLKTGKRMGIREEDTTLFKCLLKAMNRLVKYDIDRVVTIIAYPTAEVYVPKKNDVEERVNQLEFELDKTKDILTQSLSRHTKEIDRLWDMIRHPGGK